ncbi:hypothetical protein PUN28_002624 [Cardiocondyla obscurior]|uniref:Uncharacterized protein n=1 Tax=Cardiocondyla obscurior TaxID=286306 RepID=A0AAW2GVA6_9HYME
MVVVCSSWRIQVRERRTDGRFTNIPGKRKRERRGKKARCTLPSEQRKRKGAKGKSLAMFKSP